MNQASNEQLLKDAVKTQELFGFSGAQIFLITYDERKWFVRKVASDAQQNQRLHAQAAKQIAFAKASNGVIKTPTVLDQGEIDGCFYFDMEFIRGADGATFLRRASYAEVKSFTCQLVEYLRFAAQAQPLHRSGRPNFFDALFSKFCAVQQATQLIDCETMSQLFLVLDRLRQQTDLNETFCHGDLTLQNLLVDARGEIWVFDLLDAPYEHYWQDIAKLHQDLAGGWFRLEQSAIAQCVLNFVSHRILNMVVEWYPAYAKLHPLLVASTFVRILPYTNTFEQQQFVLERIKHFAQLAARAE